MVVDGAAERAGIVIKGAVCDRAVAGDDAAAVIECGIAGERTAGQHLRADTVDAAAVVAAGVAGEGAVGHRQRTSVAVDAATGVASRGIAGEDTVTHRERTVADDATATRSNVAGEAAAGDCQRAVVIDSAAAKGGGIAVGDGQVGDGHSRKTVAH